MHDALAMTEIKCLEEFEDVEPDVEVGKLGVEVAEVGVVDMLKDKRRRLTLQVE